MVKDKELPRFDVDQGARYKASYIDAETKGKRSALETACEPGKDIMNKTMHAMLITMMAAALGVASGMVPAAEQQTPKPPVKKAEPIYGSQLMTQQERDEYRAKMRAAKTQETREALRAEHHKAMQERAKERGVTLPDQPRKGGSGPGKSPGAGMGPGTGMGMGPGGGMGLRRDGSGPGPRQAQ